MVNILRGAAVALLLAASLTTAGEAFAERAKYTYLKVGGGFSVSVWAFRTREGCEAAKRKHEDDWARANMQVSSRGMFASGMRARCLSFLPLGFRRPRESDWVSR